MNKDRTRLLHMRDAVIEALEFTRGGKVEFDAQKIVRRAVAYNVQLIGEAARATSQSFRDAHGDVPWQKIIGTRNRIAHGYDSVDYELLYRIVDEELPQLRLKIEELLLNMPDEPEQP